MLETNCMLLEDLMKSTKLIWQSLQRCSITYMLVLAKGGNMLLLSDH